MHKKIFFIFLIIFLITPINTSAVSVSAKAAVVIDADTGRIIFEKNAYEKLPMASTTKIITAITAIENGTLSDVVTVSENASNTEGSSVWLEAGEQLTLSQLLYALMLESGNDAAVAIAEHIAGNSDDFLKMMNHTASLAGANNTNCATTNGLDDDFHYTTAYDLAKISAYAMKSEIFREIVSCTKTTIPWEGEEWDRTLVNHNKLLDMYPGATGIKTGFTKKSGRCLVSSAKRDGWEVIAVTLNAPDDWNDHTKLLDFAFGNPPKKEVLLNDGISLGEIEVIGSTKKVSFGVDERVEVRRFLTSDNFFVEYSMNGNIKAPVIKDETLGFANVYFNGELCKSVPLKALNQAELDKKSYILKELFKKTLITLLNLVR